MHQTLEKCGWKRLDVRALNRMTAKEVKQLLKAQCGRVQEQIGERSKGKSKLEMTGRLMESECKARCVWIDCKRHGRRMTRLIGSLIELRKNGMHILYYAC